MATAVDCSGLTSTAFWNSTSYACKILQTFQVLANASGYVPDDYSSYNYDAANGSHFDVIIVGAGTAGSLLAHRLTEDTNLTVLLIEAGGNPTQISSVPGLFAFLTHSKQDWDYYSENDGYTSQGLNGGKVAVTRGKMVGGSGALNHIIYERGHKGNYAKWAELGLDGWDYDSLLPYFLKTEKNIDARIMNGPTAKYHNANGLISVAAQNNTANFELYEDIISKSYEELGIANLFDINVPKPNGTAKSSYRTTSDAYRGCTAHEMLYPAMNRSNLYLMINTLVTKVLINSNLVATGVQVETSSGETKVFYANKEVILSAGTFNSAQLLMVSGVGPKEHLESLGISVLADLPVGQNLQDHISVPVVTAGAVAEIANLTTAANNADVTTMPLPQMTGIYSLNANRTPDFQHISLYFGPSSPLFLYILSVCFNYKETIINSHINNHPDRELLVTLVTMTTMSSRGNVTLRSADIHDAPVINFGFLSNFSDYDAFVQSVELFHNLQNTTYFTNVSGEFSRPALDDCDSLEFPSKDYWKCYIRVQASSCFHPVGTCGMSMVTDKYLKVFNITNLRVVDDSVMPYVPSSKTAAVTTMIAEKAAAMIKKKYGFQVKKIKKSKQ